MLLAAAIAFGTVLRTESVDSRYLCVSSLGPSIAFTVAPYGRTLWLLKFDGKRFRLNRSWTNDLSFEPVKFSPNGEYLAASEMNGSGLSDICLFTTRGMRLIGRLRGCTDYALSAFSSDSRYVYGCAYGLAFKWRARDGRLVSRWTPFGFKEVDGDSFDSSGEIGTKGDVFSFLVGQYHGQMVVADSDFKTIYKRALPAGRKVLRPFAVGGRRVAYEKRDANSLDLVDLRDGSSIVKVTKPEASGVAEIDSWRVRVSPTGSYSASRTLDRKAVQIWQTLAPANMWTVDPPGDTVSQDFYFVNDKVLAMNGPGDLCDAKTGKRLLGLRLARTSRGLSVRFVGPTGHAVSGAQAVSALRNAVGAA